MIPHTFAIALSLAAPDDADQQRFWNEWNTKFRDAGHVEHLDAATSRRWGTALRWIEQLNLSRPRILDLGCSTGWLTAQLAEYGQAVGTDISDAAIREAKERYPQVEFECSNFLTAQPRKEFFDIIVAVDVLSCVADQPAFIERVRESLRPGGYLYLATPNRFVYERRDDVAPLGPGQVRHWTSFREIRRLLRDDFRIKRFTTLLPEGHLGVLRAVNSYKLNDVLEHMVSRSALERAK